MSGIWSRSPGLNPGSEISQNETRRRPVEGGGGSHSSETPSSPVKWIVGVENLVAGSWVLKP